MTPRGVHRSRRWLLAIVAGIIVAACTPAAGQAELTVFAAASLRTVAEDLEAAWLSDHAGTPLVVATGASNVLAAQIAEGAPADVFLSADTRRPRELAGRGLTAAAPVTFARNRIVLVAPLEGERVTTPADLAQPGIRLVGASAGAPIASYASETIAALGATTPEPSTFVEGVWANVVSREDNVRAALAKVELGEGDAAFVYLTDALGSEAVREIPLPLEAAVEADYAVVQVSDRPLAAEFVAWLGSPAATAVLEASGFEVVR